jgi:hypothetical protein
VRVKETVFPYSCNIESKLVLAMAYALEYAGSSDGATVGTYQAFTDLIYFQHYVRKNVI